MGHGVRAALVAAILRALVEDLCARATEPARLLQELNRGLAHLLKHSRLTMFVWEWKKVRGGGLVGKLDIGKPSRDPPRTRAQLAT
jgi:hypothetical protein